MKNETTIDKAERMAENMMISWAIQEAINAKAVPISPEQSCYWFHDQPSLHNQVYFRNKRRRTLCLAN